METSAKTRKYRVECYFCEAIRSEKYFPVVGLDFGDFAILIQCQNKEILTTSYTKNYHEYGKYLEKCFVQYCQDGKRQGFFLEVNLFPEQAIEIKNIVENFCGIDYDKLFHVIDSYFSQQIPLIPMPR